MNNYKIRAAKAGDEILIKKMTQLAHKKKAWPFVGLFEYDKKKWLILKEEIKNPQNGARHFLAIDDKNKEIYGLFTYFFEPNTRIRHKIKYTWKIHPEHTGKGVGSALLDYSLKDAKKRGFKKAIAEIVVQNIGSLKLALKFGFKVQGLSTNAFLNDNGKLEDSYLLTKDLF